jgi:signal transduction histidine kinase
VSKNYSEALKHYLASLKLSLELEEKAETAAAYTNIGNIYLDLNNYEKSLEYYSEALVINSDINDKNRIANSFILIGNADSKLKKYQDALSNYKKALEIRRKLGEMAYISSALTSIGGTYSDMGDFNKALENYNDALLIRKKIDDKIGISTSLNNLGNLYSAMNNQNMALSYFEQSMKSAEETGFKYNIALCSRKIGEIYIAFKNYEKAFEYIEKSIKLGTDLENLELLKKGYWDLYNYYQIRGDFKNALEKYITSTRYSDSIGITMTNKKLIDLQVNFELSKKESEVAKIENDIALLKKQRQLDELKDFRRRQTIFILLIVTIFLLSIGLLYFNRYQLKKRAAMLLQDKYDIIDETNQSLKKTEEELIRLNSTKDKFFSIMAHDIKNPLSGLISITELMKTDFSHTSDEEKLEMFGMINKSVHQLYSLLENLLHWSRSQTGKIEFNPTKIKPFELAESNIELLKANAEKKNILIINMIDHDIVVNADKDMITLVLRNLLSNAIKFTNENGKIVIGSEKKDGLLNISVEDNGVGISKEDIKKLFRIDVHFSNAGTNNESGTGLGLILCKEFVQKHQGKIWAESEAGKGSKIIFSLPG